MDELEMQGPEIVPEDQEDEVYIRTETGEFIMLEVPDDESDD